MLYEIFKFEIHYRAKRLETYLYFIILFFFSTVAVDFFLQGTSSVDKTNSPVVIAKTMAIVSAIFMMLSSMIMGVAVLRDFEHKMESILFVKPITKRDYLLGRFLGSFVVLVFIFLGLVLGMMLGEFLPWKDVNDLLPFNAWHYIQPFIYVVLPSLFFSGAVFFVSGALSRKLIVVYTQGVVFVVLYILTLVLSRGMEDPFFASLIDPFAMQTIESLAQFWTPIERNSFLLPVEGVMLLNRLLWILVGGIILTGGYYGFSFNVIRDSVIKKRAINNTNEQTQTGQSELTIIPLHSVQSKNKTRAQQLYYHTKFHFTSLLKEISFWAIVICAMVIIFVNSISLGTSYGVDSYPRTYLIIEELQETSLLFFLIILVFFSGELVWKERGVRLNLIYDALPTSDFINLGSKFLALIFIYVILIFALILSGVLFQTVSGYYQYELDVYFIGFFIGTLPFLAIFTVISFFFQTISNHKFLGHILVVLFLMVTLILELFGYDHGLYKFGGDTFATYSDMNGYGHFLAAYVWVKLYWVAFSIILFIIAVLFSIRGTETNMLTRWKLGRLRITKPVIKMGVVVLTIFTLSGCYIFYNTNVLNVYFTPSEQEVFRVNYEKALKQFEYLPQPKIVDIGLMAELYPLERNYSVEGHYILANTHDKPIPFIHVQKLIDSQISIEYVEFEGGASINNEYDIYDYIIYELASPLQPGDSIKMEFKQTYTTSGFVERGSNTQILENGTFFNNDHFPKFAYNRKYELRDADVRESHGLIPRKTRAKIDDKHELYNARTGDDGYEINFEIVIGTDSSQIALAPGVLIDTWNKEDRSYYHYKSENPMINFYSIVSADYEVKKDKWIPSNERLEGVDLEIYYHKDHEYNLDRMMASMKQSFEYFSTNFTPYQYNQMRIMEFPRYAGYAQSFPNTVPYSESLGFMMDIDDEVDVDMPFYITAHELAHQWWGLQVIAANVQGRYMLLESLAQYSALMVMKQEYPKEKLQKVLRRERSRYLRGRANAKLREMPLALVEGDKYLHYGKGALSMYAFQNYVSEDSVNAALRRFIFDWSGFGGALQKDRYATTADLIPYFKAVTPDSLQYVIEDLFETITLYRNEMVDGYFVKQKNDKYELTLKIESLKYRVDSIGNEVLIGVNDWVDIAVYTEEEDGNEQLIYLKKHKIEKDVTSLVLLLDRKPNRAGIDPLNLLIDKDISNNLKDVSERENISLGVLNSTSSR